MNIFIVEDSELISAQLLRILAGHPRLNVVGRATSEAQAVDMILELSPDVILLDLQLAPGSGLRVLKNIREAGCKARVLVLTNNTSEAMRDACAPWRVAGFYDKSLQAQACIKHLLSWLPELPHNEIQRLKVLEEVQLLDGPQDEIFDDLRRLAQDVAATPMALISLVDDQRQWFLSSNGMAIKETPRCVAFCSHAILQAELMEVRDASLDTRFCDNPLVTGEPQLRFYAGVPLVLSTGEALGTLCVLDTVARELTPVQRRSLITLARSVTGEIEVRRRVLALEKEVTLRQEAELQIYQLATRDPLTSLPNRTTYMDRLELHLKTATRQSSRCAVLFIDLDGFKQINDSLGHKAGDAALLLAAKRLQSVVRESDTVARLGGDEFAVILPEIPSLAQAQLMGDKLCAALKEPADVAGHLMHLGASIGVAVYPEHGQTPDEILNRADLAMYQSKRQGGGIASLYASVFEQQAITVVQLEVQLREALVRDELVIHFQPQIQLASHQLWGVEVLVRWNHPQRGLLAPDQFIALAEKRHLIHEIDMQVLDKTMAQLVQWDAQGIVIPRVSVNLSARELHSGLATKVLQLLQHYGLHPQRLEIEITESAFIADDAEALRALTRMRAAGVSIAVDDFGIGYSSLGQLQRLPIDCLKIDKIFVDHICLSQTDAAIVLAIVTMARAMGMHTVAEGAESAAQLQRLRDLGCDSVQGFVFSKPLPPDALVDWWSEFQLQRETLPTALD